jgi:hypothetical protein
VTSYTFFYIIYFSKYTGITPTSKIVDVKTRVTIKVHVFIAVFSPLSFKHEDGSNTGSMGSMNASPGMGVL